VSIWKGSNNVLSNEVDRDIRQYSKCLIPKIVEFPGDVIKWAAEILMIHETSYFHCAMGVTSLRGNIQFIVLNATLQQTYIIHII